MDSKKGGILEFQRLPINLDEEERRYVVVQTIGDTGCVLGGIVEQTKLDEFIANERFHVNVRY